MTQVNKWQKRKAFQNALTAEIVVECPQPYNYQVEAWVNGRKGEPETAMLERIATKGQRPEPSIDASFKSLLSAAIKHHNLNGSRVQSLVSIAQTIAALAKAKHVDVVHLAEAIQYRPRRRF